VSAPAPILTLLLKDVSRTFYRTLRILPAAVRRQISLAYLLARATDTIADTGIVPPAERLEALQALRGRILGDSRQPLDFRRLARNQASQAEQALLERHEEVLALLNDLDAADQRRVREVLEVIISGQTLDLRRFGDASAERIIPLRMDEELDDYTYRVAGCVGEFWTKMCRAHLFPRAPIDDRVMLERGVRFGKGLQLVNVLRDLPADLRQGRCYLPAASLAAAGLSPSDLLEPANEPRLRPLYGRFLTLAQSHLSAGWAYTNMVPVRWVRVRLACAWPILIGVRTLARLRAGNVLDPGQRIKISRSEVKGLIIRSLLYYPWPRAWRNQFSSVVGGKAIALESESP
jgi:farnesyl-diphosphate farnesyltransferase